MLLGFCYECLLRWIFGPEFEQKEVYLYTGLTSDPEETAKQFNAQIASRSQVASAGCESSEYGLATADPDTTFRIALAPSRSREPPARPENCGVWLYGVKPPPGTPAVEPFDGTHWNRPQ